MCYSITEAARRSKGARSTMADALTIFPPRHPLRGRASPPGSKSITNRALLLAALSRGISRLTGALKSDDTRYMAEALRAMGVSVAEPDATKLRRHRHWPAARAGAKVTFTQADIGTEAACLYFVNARRALSNWERPQAAWRKGPDTGLGRRFETGATA